MLMCSECVMRRRIAGWERDGREPPLDQRATDALPPVRAAQIILNGTSFCAEHVVECVQLQRQSALAGPNGAPMARQLLSPNGHPQ